MGSPAAVAHGPALIGLFFNILLYGIMITQTFLYYNSYKKDKLWMKYFVMVLFFADTMNTIFDCIWIYESLIIHFGNPGYLAVADWVFATDPAMTGIIATMVQLFFAWRVKVLTNRTPVTLVIFLMAITSGLGGLGTAIAVGIIPEFVHFQKFQVVVIIWLIATCICDVAITVALTWHLRSHKTGFAATDDVVNKIIRLTVQTGMVTAVVAVIDLAMFLGSSSGLHLSFNFPLSKLYTNSLMSTLNSRNGWKQGGNRNGVDPSSDAANAHLSMPTNVVMRKSEVVQLPHSGRPEVFVHVESHQMTDIDKTVKGDSFYGDETTMRGTPSPYPEKNEWVRGSKRDSADIV